MTTQLTLSARPSLLEHSFYRRWVVGELTLGELRDYVCQYSHLVVALPRWLRLASTAHPELARKLEAHAAEEDSHVALWSRFASVLGVTDEELAETKPNADTPRMLELGDRLSSGEAGPAVAWSFEAQAPAVSAEKLAGLKEFYGIDAKSGGEYFVVHSRRDIAHAAELEAMVAALDPEAQAEAQHAADEMTDAMWRVLSSVESAA